MGQNTGCHNVTYTNKTGFNTTVEEPIPIVPKYPVEWYFRLMFLLLVASTASFSFLNYSKIAIKARKPFAISSVESSPVKNKKVGPKSAQDPFGLKSDSDDSLIMSSNDLSNGSSLINTYESSNLNFVNERKEDEEKIILLSFVFCLSFM